MAKCRKSKRHKRKKKAGKAKRRAYPKRGYGETAVIELLEYNITYDPIEGLGVPEEVERELEGFFKQIDVDPEGAIPGLNEMLHRYPNLPQIYNYLTVAYSRIGEHEKAEKIAEENYKKNPRYLFAKLNYAEICIQKNEFDKVPEIFEGKFDIKALYPDRDVFHITEVVSFWGVAGLYFAAIGKEDTARIFYKNLLKFVPDHPYTQKMARHFFLWGFGSGNSP